MKLNSASLYIMLATIIWGANSPIMKLTLLQFPVASLAFLRMFFATIIFVFIFRKNFKIQKQHYLTFFLAAFTGVTLNIGLFFLGLRLTQAILAAFLIGSIPIFGLIASHFYFKEKITAKVIIASLIALVGVAIIIGKPQGNFNSNAFLGNLFLLGSSIAWVANEIIAKKLEKEYDSEVITFYTLAIGGATFLPFAIWEFFKNPTWVHAVNTQGFFGLLYGIFFSSLIAYWAWHKGLNLIPAGQAAFFFYLDPISGAILSIILLGEKLTPQLILGGALIASAVVLAEQHKNAYRLHKQDNIS